MTEKELAEIKKSLIKRGKNLLQDGENFHVFIETAPVMINSFDDHGNCLVWNRKCEEMLGWSREDFLNSPDPLRLTYPSDDSYRNVLKDIQKTDGRFRTYSVRAKDGSHRIQDWADFRLPGGMLISFGIDITEKKEVEDTLRNNEARFRAFTEAILDILFVFDGEGRYIEIFTSSEGLLINELERLKGRLIGDVLPDDVARQHLEVISRTLETQETQMFEYELAVPKGLCWFESRTAPIRGLEGGCNLVASSVRDITRRKLADKEVREKDKLAVVIETAGAVCHELNQPLQIINGCCELLEDEEGLSEDMRWKMEIIRREVERMAKLNHSLMNITSYKTKSYLKSKIIDIAQASEKD